jgi:LysM repeat protein
LGEENPSPRIVWAIIAGLALVLAIIGTVIFFQTRPSSAIPTGFQTPTTLSSPSPIATLGSATQSSVPTNLPAPSTATATTARPTAPVVRYRVRAGDTLSEIAQKYNVTVRAIMLANGLRNETIIEGEELIIPSATPRP